MDGNVLVKGGPAFRRTLAVDRAAARRRLRFELAGEAEEPSIAKLTELTERYCVVVLQTLACAPGQSVDWQRSPRTTSTPWARLWLPLSDASGLGFVAA